MKKYQQPELEIIKISTIDIIMTSDDPDALPDDDWGNPDELPDDDF